MDKKLRATTNYNEQLTTSNGETWSRCIQFDVNALPC